MNKKAQSSLEFLLVLMVFLSFFFLFLPAIKNVSDSVFFGINVLQAKSFSENLQSTVEKASLLADGTTLKLKFRSNGNVKIFSENNILKIQLSSQNNIKTFSVSFPNEIFFETVFSGEKIFLIKKLNENISIENY
jgi:uncharacterized protein (UPF0333 family)